MTAAVDAPGSVRGRRPGGVVRALRWVLGVLGALTLSTSWALSSPVGASPDEPAHLFYAWGVVTGQVLPGSEKLSTLEDGATKVEVTVPPGIAEMERVDCYSGDPTRTPTCGPAELPPEVIDPNGDLHRWSYMTRYPPLYYGLVGVVLRAGEVLGLAGPTTLVLARIASAAIGIATVAAACLLLARRFGALAVTVAVAVVAVPAVWSHSAAVNPNGFETTAAVLLAACVGAVRADARRTGRVGAGLQVLLVVAATALAWARPLSLVWAGLLLLVLLLPVRRRRDPGPRPHVSGLSWVTVAASAAVVLAAGAWMLWSTQTRSTDGGQSEAWLAIPAGERVLLVVNRFADMTRDAVSLLGWGDTTLPMSTFLPWLAVAAVGVAALCAGARGTATLPRHALAVALGSVAAVGVHSYVSAFGWQGRYLLPVLAACVVLLVPAMQGVALDRSRRTRLGVVVLVVSGVLMVVSLLWNLGRYMYGVRGTYPRFAAMPLPAGPATWEPTGGADLVVGTAVVGTVLLVAAGVLAVARAHAVPAPEPVRPVRPAGPAEAPTALAGSTPAPTGPEPVAPVLVDREPTTPAQTAPMQTAPAQTAPAQAAPDAGPAPAADLGPTSGPVPGRTAP